MYIYIYIYIFSSARNIQISYQKKKTDTKKDEFRF